MIEFTIIPYWIFISKKYVTRQKNHIDLGYCGFIFGMWCMVYYVVKWVSAPMKNRTLEVSLITPCPNQVELPLLFQNALAKIHPLRIETPRQIRYSLAYHSILG